MKVTAFDATDGDCVLLQSEPRADGTHMTILFDGGRSGSFRDHAAKRLAEEDMIDLVCVSHIDDDHISGIVTLIDERQKQKRMEFDQSQPAANRNPNLKSPKHRVPEIGEMWHNAFHIMVGEAGNDVGTALAFQHNALSMAIEAGGRVSLGGADVAIKDFLEASEYAGNLATGFNKGVELDRKLVSTDVRKNGGETFVCRPSSGADTIPTFPAGADDVLTLHVLAPTRADLDAFESKWTEWADTSKGARQLTDIEKQLEEWRLATADGDGAATAERSSLTPANVVSIVVMAQECETRALFTGDAAKQDILEGLRAAGQLDQIDGAEVAVTHVDLLKVQHHGSPNNLDEEFAKTVTARHYLICGDGNHGNPHIKVLDDIIDSRVSADDALRAGTAEVDEPFHLWFTTHPDRMDPETVKHGSLQASLEHVKKRIAQHPDRFGATALLDGDSVEINPSAPAAVGELILKRN